VTGRLKVGILEPEEIEVAGKLLFKHVYAATKKSTTI
jgi:hypothetical protein